MKPIVTLLSLIFISNLVRSQQHSTLIAVNFDETESYLISDETVDWRSTDGCWGFGVGLENTILKGDWMKTGKRMLVKMNDGIPTDTIFTHERFLSDTSSIRKYSTGNFLLICYSDHPFFKRFELPIVVSPLGTNCRIIRIHLGNYSTQIQYEVVSEKKLTKEEKDLIKTRLEKYVEDEPDYADFGNCHPGEFYRFLSDEKFCAFWLEKKCSIRKVK